MGITKAPEDRHREAIVIPSTKAMKDDMTAMAEDLGYTGRAELAREIFGDKIAAWKRSKANK